MALPKACGCNSNGNDQWCALAPFHEIKRLREREEKLVEAAEQLADAMDTCHICKGKLVLEEYPSYCEECSPCCDEHDDPECPTINTLHRKLRTAIAAVKEE